MAQARTPGMQLKRHGSIGHRVPDVTRRAWSSYWTHRAARATVGILHGLDDRALKDIGPSRSEIESVVYGDCRRHSDRSRAHFRERRIGMC